MLKWINTKLRKFKKPFWFFNSYTIRAFKCKTDKEFKALCWKCIEEIAQNNKKDIKSISLDDIYRVLHKIRKKCPDFLRKVTLYQILRCKNVLSKSGDITGIIYSIVINSPLPLLSIGLKYFFGKRMEYVFKISIVVVIAQELYRRDKYNSKKKKKKLRGGEFADKLCSPAF